MRVILSTRIRKTILHNKSYGTGKIFFTSHFIHFIATGYATPSIRYPRKYRFSKYVSRNITFWRLLKDRKIEDFDTDLNDTNQVDKSERYGFQLRTRNTFIDNAMQDYVFSDES